MSIGSRIKERRKILNLTQEQLARRLKVTKGAVANYETGVSVPKPKILCKIMESLDCDANYLYQDEVSFNTVGLTSDEHELVEAYKKLDREGKNFVLLSAKHELKRANQDARKNIVILPYYTLPVSAGAGNAIDAEYAENIQVVNPPYDADYVVRVSGDSMEPTFYGGDAIYVHTTPILQPGEIGLFAWRGSVYIKEYGREGLISHNKSYEIIARSADIRILGKVLGKANIT